MEKVKQRSEKKERTAPSAMFAKPTYCRTGCPLGNWRWMRMQMIRLLFPGEEQEWRLKSDRYGYYTRKKQRALCVSAHRELLSDNELHLPIWHGRISRWIRYRSGSGSTGSGQELTFYCVSLWALLEGCTNKQHHCSPHSLVGQSGPAWIMLPCHMVCLFYDYHIFRHASTQLSDG